MRDQLQVCQDNQSLSIAARDWLVDEIRQHCGSSERQFTLALAGGSTPEQLYRLLGDLPPGAINWSRIVLLWGDERCVPHQHVDSNFRMVEQALLSRIEIPGEQVLAVPFYEGDAPRAAEEYEVSLKRLLCPAGGQPPQLDCVLLGIGADVHTASLFPETQALRETARLVVANYVAKLDAWRVTMTAPLINAAARVAFLIGGDGKREALFKLWHADRDPERYPAQLVRPGPGRLVYFVDRGALGDTPVPHELHVRASS